MDKPSIDRKKLLSYVDVNRQFSLTINGSKVELHFFPNSPEAVQHFPDGSQVEHIMYGELIGEKIYFLQFVTRSSFGETRTELEGADDPVMEWLKYVD
jgi:hypothetical protein